MLSKEKTLTWKEKEEDVNDIQTLRSKVKEKAVYVLDLLANTLYHPNGITRPFVYKWHFNTSTEYWKTQERLFQELLKNGFQREFFQIVFPWQTAWVVKKIEDSPDFDEAHIRFYKDGAIDIELEQGRLSQSHWRGERVLWHDYLLSLMEELEISAGDKHYIENHLFKDKQMHKLCELSTENDYFMRRIFFTMLFLWEYVFWSALLVLFLYFLSKDS